MRFACRASVIAALFFIASPAGATPTEEPLPDLPPEAPFSRTRGGVGLSAGFAYAGPEVHGFVGLFSFRVGSRFNRLVSVYHQR